KNAVNSRPSIWHSLCLAQGSREARTVTSPARCGMGRAGRRPGRPRPTSGWEPALGSARRSDAIAQFRLLHSPFFHWIFHRRGGDASDRGVAPQLLPGLLEIQLPRALVDRVSEQRAEGKGQVDLDPDEEQQA